MADIRFIVGRIRPNAEWGWKGGDPTDLAQLDWRDRVQVEPTQAEIDAEQLVVDVEEVRKAATDSGQRTRIGTTSGKLFGTLSAAQKDALLERVIAQAGAYNDDGTIKPLREWGRER